MSLPLGVVLPEQGQLVEVRQRRYVVTDVRQSTLPPDPLKLHDPTPQHRVVLASVEDDALGEELQVIWEIEPGASTAQARYADPSPRLFSVAVTFLVPEQLTR
jgi:hypothetical protein